MPPSPFEFESPEPSELLKQYWQKWYAIAHSTDLVDLPAIQDIVNRIYRLCGLGQPETIFVDSPYQIVQLLPDQLILPTHFLPLQNSGQSLRNFFVSPNQIGFSYLSEMGGIVAMERIIELGQEVGYGFPHFAKMVYENRKLIYSLLGYSDEIEFYQPYNQENLYCLPSSATLAWAFINDFSQNGLNAALPFKPDAHLFLELATQGGLCFPFEQICIVCDRPTRLLKNGQGLFHAEDEPAIQFADGYSLYVQEGNLVNEEYWNGNTEPPQWVPLWTQENLKQLTPEQLRYVAYRIPSVACQLAQDPETPPQLLQYLRFLNSPDQVTIQKHLARNPSTPTELLLDLGALCHREVLKNPRLPSLRQMYPEFPENLVLNTFQRLLVQGGLSVFWLVHKCPEFLEKLSLNRLQQLQRQDDICVSMLAHHYHKLLKKLPKTMLKQLQIQDDVSVPALMQKQPELIEKLPLHAIQQLLMLENVSVALMEQIAKHPKETAKLMLLADSRTPEPVLKQLVQGSTPAIARALPLHINWSETPEQGWQQIAESEMRRILDEFWFAQDALGMLAEMGAIPEWAIPLLQKQVDYAPILEKAALSPLTPMSILAKLATEGNYEIKTAIAINPLTTTDILEHLAESTDCYVLEQVLRHPNTPPHLLESWMQQTVPALCCAIACNPHAPVELVAGWIRRLDWQLATQFARLPDASPGFLEQLAAHPHPAVLPVVAAHPQTPPHLLEQWANIPDEPLQRVLLQNPATPAPALFSLLAENPAGCKVVANRLSGGQSPNPELESQLREHLVGGTPPFESLFKRLTRHHDHNLRAFVAALPGVPIPLLESMVDDSCPTVLWQLVKNPQTSEKALNALMERIINTGRFAPVFSAICQHPNLCLDTAVTKLDQLDSSLVKIVFPRLLNRCAIESPRLLPYLLHVNLKCSYGKLENLMFFSLLHPLINSEILASMVQSLDWLNRYAIAQHRNTALSDLEKLTQDANRVVRAAAQENLQQRL